MFICFVLFERETVSWHHHRKIGDSRFGQMKQMVFIFFGASVDQPARGRSTEIAKRWPFFEKLRNPLGKDTAPRIGTKR